MENFLYLLFLQVVWLDSLLHSIYFEYVFWVCFSSVYFTCLYKSSFLRLHRQKFLKISLGLTLQNDDVLVVDVMMNFYYRELSSKGMRLWDLFRISSYGGMTLGRVAVMDRGRERRLLKRWRKGGCTPHRKKCHGKMKTEHDQRTEP